jgi:hypothetical protein
MSEENPTKAATRKRSRRTQIYQNVFGTDDGKWVLKDLMRKYRFNEQTTVVGDPHASAFLDGKRTVVMELMNILQTDLDKLIELYESLPEDEKYE